MNAPKTTPVQRFQVVAVSAVGAVAVICYLLSLLVATGPADVLAPSRSSPRACAR